MGFVCCERRVSERRDFNRLLRFISILEFKLDENSLAQWVRLKLWPMYGIEITEEEANPHSSNLRKGLFLTTTPVSKRFVCKAPEGRLL